MNSRYNTAACDCNLSLTRDGMELSLTRDIHTHVRGKITNASLHLGSRLRIAHSQMRLDTTKIGARQDWTQMRLVPDESPVLETINRLTSKGLVEQVSNAN